MHGPVLTTVSEMAAERDETTRAADIQARTDWRQWRGWRWGAGNHLTVSTQNIAGQWPDIGGNMSDTADIGHVLARCRNGLRNGKGKRYSRDERVGSIGISRTLFARWIPRLQVGGDSGPQEAAKARPE